MQNIEELKQKRAQAVRRYLQALKAGKTGRSLGAFKGGITRRAKAGGVAVKEYKKQQPATVETVKECNSSRIGAIVATLKVGAVALVQRVKQGRNKEQAQAPAPIEAIEKLQKGAEEARACRSYQLAQEIEEAGDRLREMEGMETMAEIYRAQELEELDRWRDWYE